MKIEEIFLKIRNSKSSRNENCSEKSSDALIGMEMTAKVGTFLSVLKRLKRIPRLCRHGKMETLMLSENGKMRC